MTDNDTITHGLHWLTLTVAGWECANPDCDWQYLNPRAYQVTAQHYFDHDHAKLSERTADDQTA